MQLSDFITPSQLSKEIDVHEDVLGRWRRDGGGPPYVRLGPRKILYRRADVNAWVTSRTYQSRAAEVVAQRSCGSAAERSAAA